MRLPARRRLGQMTLRHLPHRLALRLGRRAPKAAAAATVLATAAATVPATAAARGLAAMGLATAAATGLAAAATDTRISMCLKSRGRHICSCISSTPWI